MRAVAVEVTANQWIRIPGFVPGTTTLHIHRAAVADANDATKNATLCLMVAVRGPAGPQQMCVARLPASSSVSAALDLRFGLEDVAFQTVLMSTKPLASASAARIVLNGALSSLGDAVDDITDSDAEG